jgi:hypothetical protein
VILSSERYFIIVVIHSLIIDAYRLPHVDCVVFSKYIAREFAVVTFPRCDKIATCVYTAEWRSASPLRSSTRSLIGFVILSYERCFIIVFTHSLILDAYRFATGSSVPLDHR